MKPKLTMYKMYHHWKTIHNHRKWVCHYCFLAGIPWRGITHDLSKYNPIEFFESARYYTGTSSPINEAKKEQGFSRAWLHHRGRNSHHWAYWTDNYSEGFTSYLMPKKDFVEMVCDFLAAACAYNSDSSFIFDRENKWWQQERDKSCKAMNEANKKMLDILFSDFDKAENPNAYGLNSNMVIEPEKLIKNGYIQLIYDINKYS